MPVSVRLLGYGPQPAVATLPAALGAAARRTAPDLGDADNRRRAGCLRSVALSDADGGRARLFRRLRQRLARCPPEDTRLAAPEPESAGPARPLVLSRAAIWT